MNNNIDHFNPPAIARGIADRMKEVRILHNITQASLAHRSGVSLGSIKRFEIQAEISLKSLLRLAQVLDELEAFHLLFSVNEYQSMDELLKSKQVKKRKRASHG
jgi:transcriptional regulator with XRE-family HTH domain